MKILAIADTHGDVRYDESVRARIESDDRPDLLVHAGDWSDFGHRESGMLRVFRLAIDLGIRVAYVQGNHETPNNSVIKDFIPDATDLHDNIVTYDEIVLYGLQWSLMPPQRVIASLTEIVKRSSAKRIQVTHAPPTGWPHYGEDLGDESVRYLIRELNPLVAICGHVHSCDALPRYITIGKTLVINPGPFGHVLHV